jgi:hypothetical protein
MQNSDYIALASAFIATLAFGATMWQGWITRRHNHLSVRPLLVWHVARNNSPEFAEITFSLKNKGIGPAIISDRYFTVRGERFIPTGLKTDEVQELVQTTLARQFEYTLRQFGLPGNDAAILPQEEITVAKIAFHRMGPDVLTEVAKSIDYIEFCTDYKSLYGHKFKLRTDGSHKEA